MFSAIETDFDSAANAGTESWLMDINTAIEAASALVNNFCFLIKFVVSLPLFAFLESTYEIRHKKFKKDIFDKKINI